jgi:iron complex transport system ATP-binding protein
MPMIETEDLCGGYGDGFVIRDISLAVEPGEFVAFLGRNGSGKSTLLRALQNLLPERGGSVKLGGRDISGLGPRELARELAYVPQLADPVFDFSVEEVVAMGRFARAKRLAPLSAEDRAAVGAALEAAGLEALRAKPLASLSGGERQRVFIARALAQDAPVLLLDEPSLHLDINFQVEVYGMLKRLQTEKGRTILAAEHNINLAAGYADRLVFLKDGKVEAGGTPRDCLSRDLVRRVFGAEVEIRENASTGLPEISLVHGKRPEPRGGF